MEGCEVKCEVGVVVDDVWKIIVVVVKCEVGVIVVWRVVAVV